MTFSYFYTTMQTPIGEILLTSLNGELTGLYTEDHPHYLLFKRGVHNPNIFEEANHQLVEYFTGKRKNFNLQLAPSGTPFQKKVWEALLTIPYGITKSYKDIASLLNNPKAMRAVGKANGKNPISIIVPCHRVINANGNLSGYAGGVKIKQWLLDHEKGEQKSILKTKM